MYCFFFLLYDLLWMAAIPFLFFSRRLRQGFLSRIIPQDKSKTDIWIQAASGGETYLALELVSEIAAQSPVPLRILVTSCTRQGLDIIEKFPPPPGITLESAPFPFDLSLCMKRGLKKWRPRMVVLLETELWPGMLRECKRQRIPVLVVNGRMTEKSLRSYRMLRPVLQKIAPAEILAGSKEYADRFARLFGSDRISLMQNMKFDRMSPGASPQRGTNPLEHLLNPNFPFVVLGSTRKEEETVLADVLTQLQKQLPQAVIGLFPRHMHRIPAWKDRLQKHGIPWVLRSQMDAPSSGGTIILGDVFGELSSAYALATAAFVGGTMAPCGGQNFLEPLDHGVVPCIGPHWENFSWVGREIKDQGLAREVDNPDELVHCLVQCALEPEDRESVKKKAASYVARRQGGTESACRVVLKNLGTAE